MVQHKVNWNKVAWDSYYMVLFGILSWMLAMINFNVPGVVGAMSDLREIPLLISLFYITNPLYLIGISLFTSLEIPDQGSFFSTLVMHIVPLIIGWYFFSFLKKRKPGNIAMGLTWALFAVVYYLFILLPLFVISNKAVGLNSDKSFMDFYFELLTSLAFEIVASALISALYLVQLEIRNSLEDHKENLEILVKERTDELARINENLKLKNIELNLQKEELSIALSNLKNAQSLLIQSEKMASLGTLTTGIAHEINNPLNFINGGNYILKELDCQLRESLSNDAIEMYSSATSMIQTGFDRASDIVQSLMAFSYRGKPVLIPSDFNKIIDNTLLFLNAKITPDILIEKDYSLRSVVPVYRDKIHQVLLNILDNAIYAISKYDRNGGKKLSIHTREIDNQAEIRITNTGENIPEENLKQIFDPFFTTKEPGEGIGLGLSIGYTVVKEHGGSIQVENTVDGVTFTIRIPLDMPDNV